RGDAVEYAGQIVDVDDESVELRAVRHGSAFPPERGDVYSSLGLSTSGVGRRIMASRSAPAGTMGYTESSCSTRKSISAGPFWPRAMRIAGSTSERLVTAAAGMP